MTRKLLPYEHDLIETLGVTEEEYLAFLSVQKEYNDPKAGTALDIRNMPPAAPVVAGVAVAGTAAATTATTLAAISIGLTVIGIIFQVLAVLLAESPAKPKNKNQRREERFSPRFGFNSAQELAQYGEPINLVYCNTDQNPLGTVRVGTALVWSSIEGRGSSQFMQLMLVLGAASIQQLDFERTAFGQLPLGQFSGSNVWLYYEKNGRVKYNDKVLGDGKDPSREGAGGGEDVCRITDRKNGYSQAFTPTSLTSVGVYDPIPVNVEIMERRTSGRPQWTNNGVTIQGANWKTGSDNKFQRDEEFTLVFQKALKRQDKVAQEAAKDARYQFVDSLDKSATYMLGSAMFRLVDVEPNNIDLDDNEVKAKFQCIEAGRPPTTDYGKKRSKIYNDDDLDKIELATDELEAGASIFTTASEETFPTYTIGNSYRATLTASDSEVLNIVLVPVDTYNRDIALSRPVGQWDGDIILKLKKYGYKDYEFKNRETLKWKNELDENKTAIFPRGGSIATTEAILQEFLDAKPKLDTKKVKDEINDDLEKLRQTIDDLHEGELDDELYKEARRVARGLANDINKLQKDKQDEIRRLGLDRKEVRVQKTGGGNVDVLNTKTDLKDKPTRLEKLDEKINELQDDRQALISKEMQRVKKTLIRLYRNNSSPFTAFGNRYATGGIKAMKRRLTQIKGRFTTDQIGVRKIRQYLKGLIEEKKQALKDAKKVTKDWEAIIADSDDNFYTKCLVKAEYAAYQTVTACDFVKFSIRAKLYRRVQGRAKVYGTSDAPEGFKLSDNGLQGRMAFFTMSYRETGAKNYTPVPIVFAVRRSSDQDHFLALNFKTSKLAKWEFKLNPVGDITAELREKGQRQFGFIENSGGGSSLSLPGGAQLRWTGRLIAADKALKERGPLYTNEWDLFSNRSDTQVQFSFNNGPEFNIAAVTEQQLGNITGKYDEMSIMAFNVYSGKGVQDLRSITAFVKEGKNSYVVNDNGTYSLSSSSTSYAPDIFADTILDKENGIGKYAKPDGIDWNGLALAKRFCKNNGLGTQLFMDGVIADLSSWRQFWTETAPYSLLEFARIGGKETLIPSIPIDNSGKANREVNISALFTTGNILEGSYKEEFIDYGDATQDIIATVIYRETEAQDVFPRNASVQIKLQDADEGNALRQTFDASQFITQQKQAILFGKLLCNQRRWIRRGIEFKTFPTDSPISPGAYIYVDIGLISWDRITSGLIMEGGELNAPLTDTIANGSYSILTYAGTSGLVESFDSIGVVNGTAASLASKAGSMFVLGAKADRRRAFRVTEVQMDEEGEVTVKALEHPCEESGGKLLSRVADFSDGLFFVV
jgi:hypothetical protein